MRAIYCCLVIMPTWYHVSYSSESHEGIRALGTEELSAFDYFRVNISNSTLTHLLSSCIITKGEF